MPAIPATHSVAGDVLVLAGIVVPPSGSGDFVAYTFPDGLTAYIGKDGQSVRAISPDVSATVTITVGAYSVAHKRLAELYRQQRAAGGGEFADAVAVAREDADAEFGFEQGELFADAGLRGMQARGGFRNAQTLARHLAEITQLLQFHRRCVPPFV